MATPTSMERFARWMAGRFPTHRPIILSAAGRLTTWLAYVAIVSAAISYVINGKEFFTEKLPRAVSYVAKVVLLGGTLGPALIRHVVQHDLGYAGMCVDGSDTLDLDNDGDASDLILTLYPAAQGDFAKLRCPPTLCTWS